MMIPVSTSTLFVSIGLLMAPFACQSFQPVSVPSSRRSSALFSTIEPRGKGTGGRNDVDDGFDLETTRAALEHLMMQQPQHADEALHIMTSAGRHRRQLEMDLLRQLYYDGSSMFAKNTEDGEEPEEASKAVDELMHLWMYEHDAESAMQLEAMQETCSPGMVQEEAQLRRMADDFPTWAEPRARLAILLFMKGISSEAYAMALEALELKPWHFEVFPILIMICLRHDDVGQALYWARQSLPAYRPSEGNNRRRKAWVDRALNEAAKQWEQAERETQEQQQKDLLGGLKFDGSLPSNNYDNDTWQ